MMARSLLKIQHPIFYEIRGKCALMNIERYVNLKYKYWYQLFGVEKLREDGEKHTKI